MGIYKRKQESRKSRKHAFNQEREQEKKGNAQENKKEKTLSTKKAKKRKKNFLFYLVVFLVKSVFFFFFLPFLFSFINSHLRCSYSASYFLGGHHHCTLLYSTMSCYVICIFVIASSFHLIIIGME